MSPIWQFDSVKCNHEQDFFDDKMFEYSLHSQLSLDFHLLMIVTCVFFMIMTVRLNMSVFLWSSDFFFAGRLLLLVLKCQEFKEICLLCPTISFFVLFIPITHREQTLPTITKGPIIWFRESEKLQKWISKSEKIPNYLRGFND